MTALRDAPAGVFDAREFETLMRFGPAVIYTAAASDEHAFTYVSPNVEQHLGYKPQAFLSDPDFWPSKLHPDDREHVLQGLTEAFEAGGQVREYRFRHADGRWCRIRDEARLIAAEDGGPARLVGYWIDITREVEARERQEEADSLAQDALESLPVAVALFDADDRLVLFNSKHRELFQSVRDRLTLGARYEDLLRLQYQRGQFPERHGVEEEMIAERVRQHLNPTGPVEQQFADGRTFLLSESRTSSGGIVSIRSDITDRIRLEAQLHQAQKLESVGRLAGGIAHEFNNLLMTIGGAMQVLKNRLPDNNNVEDIVAIALRATRRGSELTDRLLSYGRRQLLQTEVLDLNAAVSENIKLLHPTLGETIHIETALAEDLWASELDRNQIDAVLLNLAVNARDAMPHGGTLRIATQNVVLDDAYAAAHPDVAAGEYVRVTVTDTGAGMPAEVAEHAFEPFFTTKDVGKGSGLGLSMVHGFTKQSGGHAEIESVEGERTSVRLYFPRAERTVVAPGPTREEQTIASAAGTALVVEDDPLVRSVVPLVLEELGYATIEATDGASALTVFAAHPEITLVLADVVIPGEIDGIQLARKIQAEREGTKVVLMSGYPEVEVEARGLSASGLRLLRKPFEMTELVQTLQQI